MLRLNCGPVRLSALTLCAVLAGCGTPQERCISGVTRDLRIVDRLIAETQGNLARGYALVEQTIYVPVWEMCTAPILVQPNDGSSPILLPGRMCLDDQPRTVRRPTAIDLDDERRKLAGLQDQRLKLEAHAQPAIAQCRVSYPA